MIIVYVIIVLLALFKLTNLVSYVWLKEAVVSSKKWDLNICCGKTDGGGINADIVCHSALPNFQLVSDVTRLPFRNNQFQYVLCSHTLEHVEKMQEFYSELQRVGENVVILIPPLWDITAAFNILEHRWLFLTFKHRHSALPPHIPLPFSRLWQDWAGQKVKA